MQARPDDFVIQGDSTGTIYPPMLSRWAEGHLPADVLATLKAEPHTPPSAESEPAGDSGELRLGGIYIADPDCTGSRPCLRFLEGGTGVGAGVGHPDKSPEDLAQSVARWLGPDENIGSGVARWGSGRLQFSLTSEAGVVDYEGEVPAGTLILDSHSRINGYRASDWHYTYYDVT